MKIARCPHSWSVTPTQAVAIQRRLAPRVVTEGELGRLRLAAGADLAFSGDKAACVAAVVVWDVQACQVVEQCVVRRKVRFPYVPGLLSFREAPAIVASLRRLKSDPDVFLFDGQGWAHPRRFGLACHVGVLIDRPSLGCAKSLLVGTPAPLSAERGSVAPLTHRGECVGLALRTRENVSPVYVSIGHRLSLDAAVDAALACCTRYRLPEPTRLADQLVGRERLHL